MNFYLALPFIAGIIFIALAFLVLWRNYSSHLHRFYALFLLLFSLWGFTIFGMRASPDLLHALFWEKLALPFIFSSSAVYYLFTCAYSGFKARRGMLVTAYSFLFLVVFSAFTELDLLVRGMQVKPYGYAPIGGPLFFPLVLGTYFFAILGLRNLGRAYRTSDLYAERNRSLYLIIGMSFTLAGGMGDILPLLGLPLYPGAIIGNLVAGALTTVAILRYHLLDIRIVVRKGLAYALISVLIAIPYVGIIFALSRFFAAGAAALWGSLVWLIVLAVALQPIWRWVQSSVDRWFYRERYDYLEALKSFSRETMDITNLQQLTSSLVRLVSQALRTDKVYLLLPSAAAEGFNMAATARLEHHHHLELRLDADSALVQWFGRYDAPLTQLDLETTPYLQTATAEEKAVLRAAETELCLPLKIKGRLVGLLILGPKLSEELYSQEDRDMLSMVCSQAAVNIENARLYEVEKRHIDELTTLQESMRLITGELEINPLLQRIVDQAARLVNVPAAGIYTFEEGQRTARLRVASGLSDKYREEQLLSVDRLFPQRLPDIFGESTPYLYTEDLQATPFGKQELIREEDLRSCLVVPLVSSGSLFAELAVYTKGVPRQFGVAEIQLLQAFASQAAIALENARLYQESEDRAHLIAFASELNNIISSSLELQEVSGAFIQKLKEVMSIDYASITVVEGDRLRFVALPPEAGSQREPGETIPLEGTAAQWVMQHKEVHYQRDLARERQFATDEGLLEQGVRSVIRLPLFSKGEVIGVFNVGSFCPHAYSDRELDFLRQVSIQVAVALDKARLYTLEKERRVFFEALDKQKTNFILTVSHELKTPLTSVKASGDLLAEKLSASPDSLEDKLVENIRFGADRMQRRIGDLIDFLRAQMGMLEIRVQPTDEAKEIIEGLADYILPLTRVKNQSVVTRIPPLPPLKLDRQRFEQILLNLLSNAHKYSPGGSQIEVQAEIKDSWVVIGVIDNGPGIPLEEQDQIWEPYYTTAPGSSSLGLGLSLAKNLVEMHGGKIWVESEPVKGNAFYFTLPMEVRDGGKALASPTPRSKRTSNRGAPKKGH